MSIDKSMQEYINENQYYQRFIIKFIVLTATGIFCGWLGNFLILSFSPNIINNKPIISLFQSVYNNKTKTSTNIGKIIQDKDHIFSLQPIITNFDSSTKYWLRLDIALISKNILDEALLEILHQDIMDYVRTLSIEHIKSPQGFRYLRDDIEERIRLRSKNFVSQVILRTFIIA